LIKSGASIAATFVGNINDLRLDPAAGVVGAAGVNGGTLLIQL